MSGLNHLPAKKTYRHKPVPRVRIPRSPPINLMYQFIPVNISEHEIILGKDFSARFATEMFNYYAPFKRRNRKIQIAKETWEYAVADSIDNATWTGAGSRVVDVVTPLADFDVKGLSAKDILSISSEASYLQNLQSINDGFVNLINESDFTGLYNMFVAPLKTKLKDTNNLHILVIVRINNDKSVCYALLKVVPSNLSLDEFINKIHMKTPRVMYVPMIDSKYGNTVFTVAKRRLELRVDCKGLSPYMVNSHTI